MFCKNRIALIGFLGKDAVTGSTTIGTAYSRFSIATNVSWNEDTAKLLEDLMKTPPEKKQQVYD